jgi:hypothetical protein
VVDEFTFQGETLFVVANHFNANSDEPLLGHRQAPVTTTTALLGYSTENATMR